MPNFRRFETEPHCVFDYLLELNRNYPEFRSEYQQIYIKIEAQVVYFAIDEAKDRLTRAFREIFAQGGVGIGGIKDFIALPAMPSLIRLAERKDKTLGADTIREGNLAAGLREGEYLFLFPEMSEASLDKLNSQLNQYVTDFRSVTIGSPDSRLAIYHVHDDLERESLLSLVQKPEKRLKAVIYVIKLGGRSYKIALPEDFLPEHEALEDLVSFVLELPQFFEADVNGAKADILAAFAKDTTGMDAFFYLGHLPFISKAEISNNRMYRVLVPQKIENDVARLQAGQHEGGYRFRLRNSHYQRYNNADYFELQEKLSILEEKIANMRDQGEDRPRLLRFTQEQSPLISHVLSSYAPNDIAKIGYQFVAGVAGDGPQAEEFQYHYLFIPFEISQKELDPMLKLDNDPLNPIEYWIDPSWIRYYQQHSKLRLFVPHGKYLTPPLHSWDLNEIDSFMRQQFPFGHYEEPLYIFDSREDYVSHTGEKQEWVYLNVLDFTKFDPLNKARVIRFLNDNRIILNALSQTKKDIRKFGKAERVMVISKEHQARAAEISSLYEQEAIALANKLGLVSSELTKTLEEEFKKTIDNANARIKEADKLNDALQKLFALIQQTSQVQISSVAQVHERTSLYEQLNKAMDALKQLTTTQIQNAKETAEKEKLRVKNELDKLKREYDDIDKNINNFKDGLK